MDRQRFARTVMAATSVLTVAASASILIALCCVAEALAESSRVVTPVPCGLVNGTPWTLVSTASGTSRHGTRYYLYKTANLSCSESARQIGRLSHLTASGLRNSSVQVSNGQRLRCLPVAVPKDIKRLQPRTAFGWCGTDVTRVEKFGVMAVAGTEFFWVTADKRRAF